jgi:hypothetical protein
VPIQWFFRELPPGGKDRQSTVGQFFAGEATSSDTRVLVRESIQNSLDARLYGGTEPVRIRMCLRDVPAIDAAPWFEGAWPHFLAPDNGLNEPPDPKNLCKVLVIEDFETTGLCGDVEHYAGPPAPPDEHPFYFFYRTEGRTGKPKGKGGRWGIGKYVFPRSSRVRAFLALSIPWNGDKTGRLMGQAILNSHWVDGKYFIPDADIGLESVNTPGLVVPETSPTVLDEFRGTFGLKRDTQPGLSIVIPYVIPQITTRDLIQETIRDYFYPIMAGALVVEVSDSTGTRTLNSETIGEVLAILDGEFAAEMSPMLDLAQWALSLPADERVTLSQPEGSPDWNSSMFPAEAMAAPISAFANGERLAFRVQVQVTRKQPVKTTADSWFDVFLVRDGSQRGFPTFIRGDIIVPNVRSSHTPGVRALVLARHEKLADLLGDSEDPGHTEWQLRREGFSARYVYGDRMINFVRQSVRELVRYMSSADDQPDKDLLQDLFSLPSNLRNQDEKESKPKTKPKGDVPEPEIEAEPRRRRYKLSRIEGGFAVSHGDPDAATVHKLTIAVGYDQQGGGNPLKKGARGYSEYDFEVDKKPISINAAGIDVQIKSGNRLEAIVTEPEFRLEVVGFDVNRDLVIRVDAEEEPDEAHV